MKYHHIAAVITALTLLSFTGCNNQSAPESTGISSQSSELTVSSTSQTSETSAISSPQTSETASNTGTVDTPSTPGTEDADPVPLNITGLNGEKIQAEPISDLPPIDDLTYYGYSGFGYVAKSDGAVRVITSDELDTLGQERIEPEYAHTELGTQFGSLTLSSVTNGLLLCDSDGNTVCLGSQWLNFTGSATMKGWLMIAGDDADAYVYPGDIRFYPADGEWKGLPLTNDMPSQAWLADDFIWTGNAPVILLGSREDYDFPELDSVSSGKVYEARVTFGDPSIRVNNTELSAYSSFINPATLIGFEILDQ